MKKYKREIIFTGFYISICLFFFIYANTNGFKLFRNESGATWSNSTPYGAIHHK